MENEVNRASGTASGMQHITRADVWELVNQRKMSDKFPW
jgi:hypothetical protein